MELYLERVPRYKDTTIEQIGVINEYLQWRYERTQPKSEARKYSFQEWTGVESNSAPKGNALKFYEQYFDVRYPAWDWQHKCPVHTIAESVAYWYKANHIHTWLERNVPYDCEITREQLNRLLSLCFEVRQRPEKASSLLPTKDGEYDDYYFQCVDDALAQITGILDTTDFETQMVYYR